MGILIRKIIYKFSTCIAVGLFTGCLDANLKEDSLISHYISVGASALMIC